MPFLFFAVAASLAVVIGATALAVRGAPRFYWLAALASWVSSFLTAWSFGLYLLVFTFVFFALAIGHALKWIRSPAAGVVAVLVGVLGWWVAVSTIDDAWLFWPFLTLGRLLSS